MQNLNNINITLLAAVAEIEAYRAKPTKASSARIRKYLGSIKNDVTATRAELVAADKA